METLLYVWTRNTKQHQKTLFLPDLHNDPRSNLEHLHFPDRGLGGGNGCRKEAGCRGGQSGEKAKGSGREDHCWGTCTWYRYIQMLIHWDSSWYLFWGIFENESKNIFWTPYGNKLSTAFRKMSHGLMLFPLKLFDIGCSIAMYVTCS